MVAVLPRTIQHKTQAEHNCLFLSEIDRTDYKDWSITVAFYMALHYVTAHAVQNGYNIEPHPNDSFSPHQKRIRYVRRYIPTKFNDFKRLFDECQNARYDPLFLSRFSGDVDRLIYLANQFKFIV